MEYEVGEIVDFGDGIQRECTGFIESEDGEIVLPVFRDLN